MKRHNFSFFKRICHISILRVVALALLCAVLLTGMVACGGKEGDRKDESNQSTMNTVPKVDEDTYKFSKDITIGTVNINGMVYKDAKEQAEEECLSQIKNFTLKVSAGKKNFDYNKDSFTWDTNVVEALNKAVDFNEDRKSTNTMHLELSFDVNEGSVNETVKAIASEVDVEPVDASVDVSGNEINYVSEKSGKKVDQAKLFADMTDALDKLSIGKESEVKLTATMKTVKPKVTKDDLDGNVKLLATAESYSTNTVDGNHNMALALSSCNGSVIDPGEVWSFNDCTGDSNLTSNGYRGATVIMGGKFEQGIGGGICQASTVIYQAALKSNLGIYERYSHYFKSSYADVGLDATIDYPSLDLKLQNNTDYPIYLQCYMEGTTLYASFYGWQDPSFDEIKLSSWTYNEDYANNSYYAAAQRTFYKDGKKLYSEDLPVSHYGYYSPDEEKETKPKPTKPTPKPTKPTPKPTEPIAVPTEPPVTAVPAPVPTPAPAPVPTEAPVPTV